MLLPKIHPLSPSGLWNPSIVREKYSIASKPTNNNKSETCLIWDDGIKTHSHTPKASICIDYVVPPTQITLSIIMTIKECSAFRARGKSSLSKRKVKSHAIRTRNGKFRRHEWNELRERESLCIKTKGEKVVDITIVKTHICLHTSKMENNFGADTIKLFPALLPHYGHRHTHSHA